MRSGDRQSQNCLHSGPGLPRVTQLGAREALQSIAGYMLGVALRLCGRNSATFSLETWIWLLAIPFMQPGQALCSLTLALAICKAEQYFVGLV